MFPAWKGGYGDGLEDGALYCLVVCYSCVRVVERVDLWVVS
jgi:hypothetical protein